ncbi:MAG: hypothetical protein J1E79_01975 [Rikenella sp.]|nr:hypothetical protein [Rikenella sp.]
MTTHHRDTAADSSRIVVIKRYSDPNEAYWDAERLENNGIPCSVDGAIGGTLLPFIQGQVGLSVAESDAAQAVALVPGSALPEEE